MNPVDPSQPTEPSSPQPSDAQSTPQPPHILAEKKRKTRVRLLIGGGILLIIGTVIIMNAARFFSEFGGVIGTVSDSVRKNADYPDRVAAYGQVNKTFTKGQTMQYGPVDMTATQVTQNYQPSAELAADIQRQTAKERREGRTDKGLDLTDAQYVLVSTQVNYQKAREGQHRVIFQDGNDVFVSSLNNLQLDGMYPIAFWLNDVSRSLGQLNLDEVKKIKSGDPARLTYLYRVPLQSEGTLVNRVVAYTRVSSIVGTEGMPSQRYTYSLSVW